LIVPKAEIDLILSPRRLRRRVMRLPADGATCPLAPGRVYKLQERVGATRATITVAHVSGPEPLAELTINDARAEGRTNVDAARDAWYRWFGPPRTDQQVWVVSFLLGDQSAFLAQDDPIYLQARSRDGGMSADYTNRAAAAIIEDGMPVEVCVLPNAGERARVLALARRRDQVGPAVDELATAAAGMAQRAGELRESMIDMKARNELRLAQKALATAQQKIESAARLAGSPDAIRSARAAEDCDAIASA